MKHSVRTIRVYEGKSSKVEVEGKTVTVHWVFKMADGKTVVNNGILLLDVAMELNVLLNDALALPGEAVVETGLAKVGADIEVDDE
jgi:hypothetical protein